MDIDTTFRVGGVAIFATMILAFVWDGWKHKMLIKKIETMTKKIELNEPSLQPQAK